MIEPSRRVTTEDTNSSLIIKQTDRTLADLTSIQTLELSALVRARRNIRNGGKRGTVRQSGKSRENLSLQELYEESKERVTEEGEIANITNVQGQ